MWLQTWVKQLTQEQILFLKVILLSSCMQPLFWFAVQKSIDCTRHGICNKVNLFSCNIILSVIFFNQDRDYCHWKQFNFVHLNLMDCSLRRQKGINRIQLKNRLGEEQSKDAFIFFVLSWGLYLTI